jgi:hypothetical protein
MVRSPGFSRNPKCLPAEAGTTSAAALFLPVTGKTVFCGWGCIVPAGCVSWRLLLRAYGSAGPMFWQKPASNHQAVSFLSQPKRNSPA